MTSSACLSLSGRSGGPTHRRVRGEVVGCVGLEHHARLVTDRATAVLLHDAIMSTSEARIAAAHSSSGFLSSWESTKTQGDRAARHRALCKRLSFSNRRDANDAW